MSTNIYDCRDLYIELLKRTITGTLFSPEPDREKPQREEIFNHYFRGPAITLLTLRQLDNIRACIEEILKDEVPGDVIETGVWRGGATVFMRGVLKAYHASDRCVWVADSFEGLPDTDSEQHPKDSAFQENCRSNYENLAATLDEVHSNFEAFGLMDEQVRFLKGWFKDTLPAAPIERLSLMRLDGDYYESTMTALNNLYDKLSVGGFVIVDDYEHAGLHCGDAVDEFRAQRGIRDEMMPVDFRCYYWRKTSETTRAA